jgi:Gram-negative porin
MRGRITLAALAMSTAPAAFAQADPDGWKLEARLTVAGSAIDDETPLAPAGDGLLGSGSLAVTRADTFENGLTLEWRGEVRIDRDAASRPAFAGVLGDCPAADIACPRVASSGGFLSPVSPATGLAPDGPLADGEAFGTIESASVSLSGAWGEGVLGLDSGVAARLDARAPTVLQRVSAASPGLDSTGLVTTRARNDVTGSSFKASYMSPRWLGFRLGGSFTPQADQRSADFDPDFGGAGLANAELENAWEGAVSFDRRFQPSGVRVRAALTYSAATSSSGLVGFGDYEAWGAGLELERGSWTGGLRWLSSNNAWDSGNGDYEAWEAGLIHQGDEWRFGIEGGWSEDQLSGTEGASWLVGASRRINRHLDLGVAWTSAEADMPVLIGPSASHRNARNEGLVFELTVRN